MIRIELTWADTIRYLLVQEIGDGQVIVIVFAKLKSDFNFHKEIKNHFLILQIFNFNLYFIKKNLYNEYHKM